MAVEWPDPPLVRFDQSGKAVKSFGDGMFVQAHGAGVEGVAADAKGNLYAAEVSTEMFKKYAK